MTKGGRSAAPSGPHRALEAALDLTDLARVADHCRDLMARDLPGQAFPYLEYLRGVDESDALAGDRADLALLGVRCCAVLSHGDLAEVRARELISWADGKHRLAAQILLAEIQFAQGRHDELREDLAALARDVDAGGDDALRSGVAWLRGELARAQDDGAEAAAQYTRSRELAVAAGDRARAGLAIRGAAQITWSRGEVAAAERLFRESLDVVTQAGLRHAMGEAQLQCGIFVGEVGPAPERADPPRLPQPAADYLALAKDHFEASGSLADLDRVRRAFQIYGRRATDRVADARISGRDDESAQSHRAVIRQLDQHLLDLGARLEAEPVPPAAHAAVWEASLALRQQVRDSVVRLRRLQDELVNAANEVVLQRQKLGAVLDGVRRMSSLTDRDEIMREVVRLVADVVDVDRVVLALVDRRGELGVRAEVGTASSRDTFGWRVLAERARRLAESVLESDDPGARSLERSAFGREGPADALGVAVAAPVGAAGAVHGVLYADRRLRRGVISDADVDLMETVCAQVATLLDNQRMNWALRVAARTREATVEAISDGVLSITPEGTISSVNRAGAKLLGLRAEEAEGRPVGSVAGLASVAAKLGAEDKLEGRLLRLPGGEAMVTARAVIDGEERAGTVVTLTAMKRARRTAQRLLGQTARFTFDDQVGQEPAFLKQLRLAEAAARSDASVLITGESGTGKEVMAQAIHNASRQVRGPFVRFHAATIPRDLAPSELFGHEEVADPAGPREGKPGKLELADGGTILLDEIGDLSLELQDKLLATLESRSFRRVGGSVEHALGARIITTASRDLDRLVRNKRFREELLYRLKVIHLHLPPLRERPGDVERLVQAFVQKACERLGRPALQFTRRVLEAFATYDWPGNIRELEYVVESEVNLAEADAVRLTRVPAAIDPNRQRGRRTTLLGMPGDRRAGGAGAVSTMSLHDAEQELLVAALTEHRGSVPAVAKALGISRGTVYNKLRKYELSLGDFRSK